MKTLIVIAMLAAPVFAQQTSERLRPGTYAHFETSMGNFSIELYSRLAPNTVANFVGLANGSKEWKDPKTGAVVKNKRFYDGLTFHRVVGGFVVQGGDPLGTGTGGPGYRFADEFAPTLKHDREGRVSMANSGRNTNGSQFFITLAPQSSLDGKHSIFGQVVRGMEVVKAIGKVPTTKPADKPRTPIVMRKVTIERVQ